MLVTRGRAWRSTLTRWRVQRAENQLDLRFAQRFALQVEVTDQGAIIPVRQGRCVVGRPAQCFDQTRDIGLAFPKSPLWGVLPIALIFLAAGRGWLPG